MGVDGFASVCLSVPGDDFSARLAEQQQRLLPSCGHPYTRMALSLQTTSVYVLQPLKVEYTLAR